MAVLNKNIKIPVMEIPEKIMDPAVLRTRQYFPSSTSLDMNVENLGQSVPSSHMSVTTVLNYCKSKILNPYLRLLSIIGLRSLTNQQEPCACLLFLNYMYTVYVIIALLIGYFLQYMSCFRRDRGFCYIAPLEDQNYIYQTEYKNDIKEMFDRVCHGPIIFSFIIPSCLHFLGFLHAMIIIRHSEDDQLPVLMERVFLSSTNLSNGFLSQKKLVKTLWLFVVLTSIWMILSFISIIIMMGNGDINFKWLENKPPYLIVIAKILLIFCTIWHDIVQATIVSNYCLQTQLLTSYLQFLRDKLLQYPIEPLEWIRHIENFKSMLNFINIKISPSVCIFTFMNLTCAISGLAWLFNYDHVDTETVPIKGISILNVGLWVLISLAPFVQAAKLSTGCDILRSVGQQVRTRPFVHQDTPGYELDSILLYTASLKLKAKLFYIPVTGKYLCFLFTLAGIAILVLGQCHYIKFN